MPPHPDSSTPSWREEFEKKFAYGSYNYDDILSFLKQSLEKVYEQGKNDEAVESLKEYGRVGKAGYDRGRKDERERIIEWVNDRLDLMLNGGNATQKELGAVSRSADISHARVEELRTIRHSLQAIKGK